MPYVKSAKEAQDKAQELANILDEAVLICAVPHGAAVTAYAGCHYRIISISRATDEDFGRSIDCKWRR